MIPPGNFGSDIVQARHSPYSKTQPLGSKGVIPKAPPSTPPSTPPSAALLARKAARVGGVVTGITEASFSAWAHIPAYTSGKETGIEASSHIIANGAIGVGSGFAGLWVGAKAGAAIGTALEPGLGTLAGGIVGGAVFFVIGSGLTLGLVEVGKSAKEKVFSYIDFGTPAETGVGLPKSVKDTINNLFPGQL